MTLKRLNISGAPYEIVIDPSDDDFILVSVPTHALVEKEVRNLIHDLSMALFEQRELKRKAGRYVSV